VSLFETTFYENPVWRWFLALGVILFVWFVLRVVLQFVVRRLRRLARRTPTRFDDLIAELLAKTKFVFVVVLSLYAGSLILSVPDTAARVLRILFILALLLQAGYWGNAFVSFWINRTVQKRLEQDAATATSMAAFGFLAKLAVWGVVLLLALENMGFDISALLAGLGIGGIAVALAVQNVLGDLFASLSIVVDKPFVIGDFIIVGDLMGNVERIGLKTTRVRSLSGEQIIFSNSDLLSSRVRNYKRMYERRIVFAFGVTYQTAPDVLEGIPETVRGIIEAQSNVRFDRCHFKLFGDFSLDFEAVYYVLVSDYNVYMDRQQTINLGIMRAFEEQGIDFAYPTHTLFVSRFDASESEQQ
jgi:small-conductance mechanosensitive channel